MTVRYTQSDETFKQRKFNGMKFSRSVTATTKADAAREASKIRGKGALVRIVKVKSGYELYTR